MAGMDSWVGAFQTLLISDTDPAVDAPPGWLRDGMEWLNTSDHCLYRRSGSGWTKIIDVSDHPHESLGDVDFTGYIKVGGAAGISGSRLIPGVGTLTFTNGILTNFEPA